TRLRAGRQPPRFRVAVPTRPGTVTLLPASEKLVRRPVRVRDANEEYRNEVSTPVRILFELHPFGEVQRGFQPSTGVRAPTQDRQTEACRSTAWRPSLRRGRDSKANRDRLVAFAAPRAD